LDVAHVAKVETVNGRLNIERYGRRSIVMLNPNSESIGGEREVATSSREDGEESEELGRELDHNEELKR
jgi:hypothetical protein